MHVHVQMTNQQIHTYVCICICKHVCVWCLVMLHCLTMTDGTLCIISRQNVAKSLAHFATQHTRCGAIFKRSMQ